MSSDTGMWSSSLKLISFYDSFYREIHTNLKSIGPSLFKKRILSRILSISIITEPASSHLLSYLFSPTRGILSDDEWHAHVLPHIMRYFRIRNRALRTKLLASLHYYVTAIDANILSGGLLQEIALGLRDLDDNLVCYSATALVTIAQVLAQRGEHELVNNAIVRPLHQLAVCESSTDALKSHCLMCLIEMWTIPNVCYSPLEIMIRDD